MFCVYLRSFSSATSDHIASAGTTDLFCITTHLQSEPGHSSIELLFRINLPKTQNCSNVYTCWSRLRGRLWVGSLTSSFGIQAGFGFFCLWDLNFNIHVRWRKCSPGKDGPWVESFFLFCFCKIHCKKSNNQKKKKSCIFQIHENISTITDLRG